jgi:hypothetical protein
MDVDTDLFVQGFWAKCTETIRPELDLLVSQLQDHGHEVNVSSQDYSAGEKSPSDANPLLTLSVRLKGARRGPEKTTPQLQFRGDVNRKVVEVASSMGPAQSFELADLDLPKVKNIISDWLTQLDWQ